MGRISRTPSRRTRVRQPAIWLRWTLAIALLALPALEGRAQTPPLRPAPDAPRIVPDQLLVKLEPRPKAAPRSLDDGTGLSDWMARHGAVEVRRAFSALRGKGASAEQRALRARALHPERAARAPAPRRPPDLENTYLVTLAPGSDLRLALAAIAAHEDVVHVEPNLRLRVTATPLPAEPFLPDDVYVTRDGATWAEDSIRSGLLDLWGLEKLRAIEAWNRFDLDGSGDFGGGERRPGEGIVIAIVDTGVDVDHPDLAGRIFANPGELAGNGIDDDGNGLVDDTRGWDFVDGDPTAEDRYGHGTHVAGTAAARADALGIAGVAPWAEILPLKGLGDDGSGSAVDLANAVVYAGDMGADVVSNSWSGLGSSQILADAFAYVEGLGALSIASAGNASSNVSGFVPATYPSVMAVAASDVDDRRASFSNTGHEIALTAPGVDVLSLHAGGGTVIGDSRPGSVVDDDYLFLSGTSMSAPHASGAAAVLMSFRPGETVADVRSRLLAGALPIDDLNPGFAGALGRGRVDLLASLVATPAPVLRIEDVAAPDVEPGATVDVVVAIRNEWLAAGDVRATLSTASPDATVVRSSAQLGDIAPQQVVDNAAEPFRLAIAASAPLGTTIPLDLRLDLGGGTRQDLAFHVVLTQFVDVATQVGLPVLDVIPWNASLQDFDGNRDVDAQWIGFSTNFLLRNTGGAFEPALDTGIQPAAVGPSQPLFLDADDDGDRDLFFAGFNNFTGSQLYESLGDGQFADVTDESGTRGLRAFTATAFDWDEDGRVDFLGSSAPFGTGVAGQGLFLMRNFGGLRFEDVSPEACLDPNTSLVGGEARAFDYDGDGHQDLLLASPDTLRLYRGSADGRFFDATRASGLVPARPSELVCEFRRRFALPRCGYRAVGTAVGDYDDDGDLDLFLTGRGPNAAQPSQLYRNDGSEGFRDVTAVSGDLAGTGIAGMHRGNAFFDYDNDGDLDLYVTSDGIGAQANTLYRNEGDGTFSDVNRVAFDPARLGSGAAAGIGDYDRDGALDIYAPSGVLGFGEGAFFENRVAARNHWLSLRLHGRRSHRDAFGARVTLVAGGRSQTREVSISAVDPERLHFGLGDAPVADEVRIRWPSGIVHTLSTVSADQELDVEEPLSCEPRGGRPEGDVACPREPTGADRREDARRGLQELFARLGDLRELRDLLRDLRAQGELERLEKLRVRWDNRCRRWRLTVVLADLSPPEEEEPGGEGPGRGPRQGGL